jgi:parvulin-like peptidyl-prolyl isomerase
MLDEFAVAAFALEKGALSEPLTTVFGTHLIRVTDIKTGTRQWTEVIPQIKTLASTEMFSDMALQERKKAKIEFSGLTPYYKPDSKELVVPPTPQQATGR